MTDFETLVIEKLNSLEKEIGSMKEDIGTIRGQVDFMQVKMDSMGIKMDNIDLRLANLEHKVNKGFKRNNQDIETLVEVLEAQGILPKAN